MQPQPTGLFEALTSTCLKLRTGRNGGMWPERRHIPRVLIWPASKR